MKKTMKKNDISPNDSLVDESEYKEELIILWKKNYFLKIFKRVPPIHFRKFYFSKNLK